ncbi:hypothetical protein BX666DRAFT_334290 [Dichotomocladium elegans]|nr:hypothetical protein BX666DRAFT_334290 [Dichotomocladium elegans]
MTMTMAESIQQMPTVESSDSILEKASTLTEIIHYTNNKRRSFHMDHNNDSDKEEQQQGHPQKKFTRPNNAAVVLQETYRRRSAPQIILKQRRQSLNGTTNEAPRWHSQAYLLFIALRQHPEKCLPRTDLIRAALDLDEKISKERNLPRLFRGKTPMNSASAILTHNIDRYFIPYRPAGSRCLHFRLAYDPGNLKDAIRAYNRWESELIRNGWPMYFGRPIRQQGSSSLDKVSTEFDEFLLNRRHGSRGAYDTTQVPRSWSDVVRVVTGDQQQTRVVAVRKLPANIPVGFYFGVPLTSDEFDSLKDGIGVAAEKCVLYGKNILDPTDDEGQLLHKEIYCPFHYMRETTDPMQANMLLLEGTVLNQVICWTKREIQQGEELLLIDKKDLEIYC